MNESSNKSQAHIQKLNDGLKTAFPKLNDADRALLASSPDKFYEAVKTKQSIERAEAEKTVKELDTKCAAACAANSNSTDTVSKPAPKAANA